MSRIKYDLSTFNYDSSNTRGRVLWLVYHCIENRIHDISAKSHFVKKCGLGNSFVSDLEKDENQNPSDTSLRKIVNGIGCNRNWLFHNEGKPFDKFGEVSKTTNSYDDSDFVTIPFYPNVKASAGHGFLAQDERSLDIAFRSYFIEHTLNASHNDLVAIKATGDSMYPDIRDGDLLVVDTSKKSVQSENPYLVVRSEQVMVKYVRSLGQNNFRLISRNEIYDDEIIEQSSGEFFEILGEVKHIQRTI